MDITVLAQMIVAANRTATSDADLRIKFALIHEHARAILEAKRKQNRGIGDCTCFKDCQQDSHSGDWHQHEDDPCPVHPETVMVG